MEREPKGKSSSEVDGQAKTELPEPRERWTEENLPTLPPDVRYEMIDEVGRGGMGKVMRAYDRRLDRPIAIKSMLGSREHVTRFLHEARITARLEHPGVVPVHDAGRLGSGEPFYAMKLVSGRTFAEALETAKGLAGRLALLSSVIDVAFTVAYAHSQGVIHRDLKPHNVLVGDYGETLVIDWGLSKEIGRDAKPGVPSVRRVEPLETMEGGVLGTAAYMPPEQARGEPLDGRADVWAIGALLYSLLTLHAPHAGRSTVELLASARSKTPRPIRELEPDAPPDLVAVVERAMEMDRENRYPDALALAHDLRRYQMGRLVQARNYGLRELVVHWVRRNLAVVVLATLLTMVVSGIAVLAIKRVVTARETAVAERKRAESRESLAQKQAAQLMLTEARAHLDQDPTTAFAGLKRLVASPAAKTVDLEEIRLVAAEALARGVIRHTLLGHTAQVNVVACDETGTGAVSLSEDGTLRAWDIEHGTAAGEADAVKGRVHAMARSRGVIVTGEDDGVVVRDVRAHQLRRLVTGSATAAVAVTGGRIYGGGADGQLHAWPRDASVAVATVSLGGPVTAIAATEDGDVAAATSNGEVWLWRGDLTATPLRVGLRDPVKAIAFDPSKHLLAVTKNRFWEWDTEHPPRELYKSDDVNHFDLAESLDGRWLGFTNGRTSLLVDRTSQTPAVTHDGVDSIAFSPSGTTAALTQRDGLVLRDLASGVDRKLGLFRNAVGVRFATETRIVVGGVDGEVFVLDIAPLVARTTWHFGSAARAIEFASDGASLLTFTLDRNVRQLEVATRAVHDHGFDTKIVAIALGRDPRTAFVSHGTVTRVDLATGARTDLYSHDDALYCLADTKGHVAFSDAQRNLHVVDLETHQDTVFQQRDVLIGCAAAADGALVVGTDTGHVRRIDLATGTVVADDTSHRGPVTNIAILPDGDVASISTDGTARLLHGGTSTVIARHDMPLWGLAASNRGLVASAGSDRSIRITDREGHVVRILRGHTDDVSGAAFSPDGSAVASSSLDGTVRLWPVGNDSPPRTLDGFATWLDQHTSIKPAD